METCEEAQTLDFLHQRYSDVTSRVHASNDCNLIGRRTDISIEQQALTDLPVCKEHFCERIRKGKRSKRLRPSFDRNSLGKTCVKETGWLLR